MYSFILNDMIIINGHDKSLVDLIQFIDQAAGQDWYGRQFLSFQNGLDFLAGFREYCLNSRQKVGKEKMKIVIGLVYG